MRFLAAAAAMMFMMSLGVAICEENSRNDPNQFFYNGNLFYEKREYKKAADEYRKVITMGLENGRLYYNLGNALFKLGELGEAILYYEKAARLIPQDGDLRSNMSYAKSLVGGIIQNPDMRQTVISIIKMPFKDFNLNALSIATAVLYVIFMVLAVIFIVSPPIRRRIGLIFYLMTAAFILSLIAFGVRYYDEEMQKHGVVLDKSVEIGRASCRERV